MHLVVSTEEPNTQTAEEMCPTLCAPLESSKKDIRDPDDRERKQALVERGCRLIKSKQQTVSRQNFTLTLSHGLQCQGGHGHKRGLPISGSGRKTCQTD